MYKKLLEKYFDYLGNQQPRNGVILFHLQTFCDWLDLQNISINNKKINLENDK